MTRRNPGGRPPADPAKRRRQVKVYLETEEIAALQIRAAECGISLSAYLRRASLGKLPPQVPEINRTAFASLARINSNLNQFMAAINAGRAPEVALPDLHELYGLLLAVRHDLVAGRRRARRRRR